MDDQQTKLNLYIERLEVYQKANDLSDVKFVARFQRFLGSTKTWRQRLCARNWIEIAGADGTGINVWTKRLASLVAELDGSTDLQSYLDELPISRYAQIMYERLQGQGSDRRCVILVGNYGVGKSWALRMIWRNHMADSVYIESDVSWKSSWTPIVNALADAIGTTRGASAAGTFANVLESLRLNPMTLLIDEGHEGGVLLLKMLKTIINQTRSRVMLATYPTGWNRLTQSSQEAYQEARQLLGRTIKPIETRWANGISPEDCAAYLAGACEFGKAESLALAKRISGAVAKNGNFRLLADAVVNAVLAAESHGETLSAKHVDEAVALLCSTGKPTIAND